MSCDESVGLAEAIEAGAADEAIAKKIEEQKDITEKNVRYFDTITALLASGSRYHDEQVAVKGVEGTLDGEGCLLVYDITRSSENDGYSVFDGWVRQDNAASKIDASFKERTGVDIQGENGHMYLGTSNAKCKAIWGNNNALYIVTPLNSGGYTKFKLQKNYVDTANSYGGAGDTLRVVEAKFVPTFFMGNRNYESVKDESGANVPNPTKTTALYVDLVAGGANSIEWDNVMPQNGRIGIEVYTSTAGAEGFIFVNDMQVGVIDTDSTSSSTEERNAVLYVHVNHGEPVRVKVVHDVSGGGHLYVRSVGNDLHDFTQSITSADFTRGYTEESDYLYGHGSNDYAISLASDVADSTYIGSNHGGVNEISSQSIVGDRGIIDLGEGGDILTTHVTNKLEIYHKTTFDNEFEGEIDSVYKFIDNGYGLEIDMHNMNIITDVVFTSLTCTARGYDIIAPVQLPQHTDTEVSATSESRINSKIDHERIGGVTQSNGTRTLESRWTIFPAEHCWIDTEGGDEGAFVSETLTYNKVYNAVIRGYSEDVNINKLAFKAVKLFT